MAGVTMGNGGVQAEGWVAIEQLFQKKFRSLIARTHMVNQTHAGLPRACGGFWAP